VETSGEKKLNKEQLDAVRHKKGPLLIIAGAGTGKTTVITERIKYLIEKNLVKPSEILALTFTEKAAREMEERVDVTLPYGYTQMWISTFHSFCDRVLRDNALHIGLDPRYKLMTGSESIQLIRKNLFKFDLDYFRPLGNPTKFIDGMLQHFSRLQDEDLTPAEYIKWVQKQGESRKKVRASHGAKSSRDDSAGLESLQRVSGAKLRLPAESKKEIEKWEELAEAYQAYEELKVKEGVMDFGDLIVKTLKLFRDRPNILKNYQKQFKYILVDEFQDTNISQNELVKLLAGYEKNITVVLDDDQSIYRFRGAAVSNALYFRKNFPKAKIVTLIKNYRSSQEILDKAYQLIQFNNPDRLEVIEKIDKKLVAQRKDLSTRPSAGSGLRSGLVHFIHSDRVENEAETVAKEIVKLVNPVNQVNQEKNSINPTLSIGRQSSQLTKLLQYRDIAVLVRANNHSDPFIRAFQRHGIPYQFLGPGRLFKQPEIIDLIAYLKVLYDFEDSVSYFRLLSFDYFGISARDLIKLANYAKRNNLSLFEATEQVGDVYVSEDTKDKVDRLTKLINKNFDRMKRETAGQLLYYFLEETGMLPKLLNPDTAEAQKRAINISKFFDKLKTYEVDHEDASVTAVVDWIELASELGESPLVTDADWTEVNAVNILTTHSAKGLEFPVVFLVNLVSQRFPTVERKEKIPIPEELIKEVLPQGDYHLQEERRLFYVGMTRAKERLYFTAANYYGEGKREKKLSPFIFEALGDEVVSAERSRDESQQLSFLDYKPPDHPPSTIHHPPIHIDYLSYSQIETFKTCPLHFKLRYIYKLSTPPSASQSFGTSIHETMKELYRIAGSGKIPKDEKRLEKMVLDIYKKNWVNQGFNSKAHEKKFYEKGKIYLAGYLKEEFRVGKIPSLTEQRFTIPLPGKKGEKPLKIGGVMDRVDESPDGSIAIMDYKTGATIPTQKEVDGNMQLTFYALAASRIPEEPFKKNPEDISLSLYFFDNQEKLTTKRTRKELEKTLDEVYKVRKEIEESDFKCSGHIFCENCEYKLFCRSDD